MCSWGTHSQDLEVDTLSPSPSLVTNLLWDPGKSLLLAVPQFPHCKTRWLTSLAQMGPLEGGVRSGMA